LRKPGKLTLKIEHNRSRTELQFPFSSDTALKTSGSAGILPAFRAAIAHTLRAGCPRSRVLHGSRAPLSRQAGATALKFVI